MMRPCVDCATPQQCQAVGFNCGHDDTVRIRKRTPDEMIIELQMKVHVLESRLEALERHKHTVTFDLHEYTQQVTTSGICYAAK